MKLPLKGRTAKKNAYALSDHSPVEVFENFLYLLCNAERRRKSQQNLLRQGGMVHCRTNGITTSHKLAFPLRTASCAKFVCCGRKLDFLSSEASVQNFLCFMPDNAGSICSYKPVTGNDPNCKNWQVKFIQSTKEQPCKIFPWLILCSCKTDFCTMIAQ